jgi:hypothetical protein
VRGADFFDRFQDRIFGTEEVETFGVGWIFVAFGEDVTDRIFPPIDGFNLNQLGFRE